MKTSSLGHFLLAIGVSRKCKHRPVYRLVLLHCCDKLVNNIQWLLLGKQRISKGCLVVSCARVFPYDYSSTAVDVLVCTPLEGGYLTYSIV